MTGLNPQPGASSTPNDPFQSALPGTPFHGPYPSFEASRERTPSATPQLFPHPHRVGTVAPRQGTPLFLPPNQVSTPIPSRHTPIGPPPPFSHPMYDPYFPPAETPSGCISFHEHPQPGDYQPAPTYYAPDGYVHRTRAPPQPFHLPPPVILNNNYNQPGLPVPSGGPPGNPPGGPSGSPPGGPPGGPPPGPPGGPPYFPP